MAHLTERGGRPVTYLTCTETAVELRKALKQAFPGQKFSVRSDSYAGGASIRVRWTDGPVEKTVEKVARGYAGATFDGMIDLKSHHTSLLRGPDGDAVEVQFAADFVFCDRDITPEHEAACIPAFEAFTGERYEADRETRLDDRRFGPWKERMAVHLHRFAMGEAAA